MARSVKAKRFLLQALAMLIIVFAGYLVAFGYQLGSHVKAEWWVKNIYDYKGHLASSIEDRKILMVAGSNALFGLDSAVIEETTGYPVVNLAAHGALSLGFHYYKIKRHMKPGDIVVLPLELAHYYRDRELDWFVDNMSAWGWEDYLGELSLYELLRFIALVPSKRIVDGVIKQNGTNPLVDPDEVIAEVERQSASSGPRWQGYSYRSLNKYGDFIVPLPPTDKPLRLFRDGNAYLQSAPSPTQAFLDWFSKIRELVDQRGGQLIVTWPITIRNKGFDLSRSAHQHKAEEFKKQLAKQGITLQCNPALFNLDVKFFFDTQYHANKYGALIRSENLAACVKRILGGESYQPMSYSRANMIVREQEIGYSRMIEKMSTLFTQRMQDLQSIKSALERYFADHGKYPVSEGWDGLLTKWGKSGKDWIPGLAPNYLPELPRDPRMSKNAGAQYIYKSNGRSYKLIAHTPEDCDQVKRIHPELIDPKRVCRAYGYWSNEAADW